MNHPTSGISKIVQATGSADGPPSHPSPRINEQSVLDDIIDHLRDDKRALSNCALVAHNFVHASRRHLFHEVNIWAPAGPGTVPVIDGDLICLEKFTSLLLARHTTIPRHVRHISIRQELELPHHRRIVAGLRLLVKHLPFVTSIELLNDLVGLGEINIQKFLGGFKNLKKLHGRSMTHFPAFARMLSKLTQLETLEILWPNWEYRVSVESFRRLGRLPPRLRHLDVGEGAKDFIMIWWMVSTSPPPIESVVVSNTYGYEAKAIGNFLRCLGRSLQHLKISFKGPPIKTEDTFNEHVNLQHNTSLRSIIVGPVDLRPNPNKGVYTSWLTNMLERLNSDVLENIDIRLPIQDGDLDGIDWKALDTLFSTKPFKNLKDIVFTITDAKPKKGIKLDITGRLPGCRERGILKIAFPYATDSEDEDSDDAV